ncbi:MAG: phage antirepressor KilAC domain-containing protein, partial [Ruminococcus sp.]|nr:phage antirepressor KilAC domain-containing protein [Ruminococcus sp.]
PTDGGEQKVNFIPEGDLYRLIVRSKLPQAEKFERWVFDEVLPTIRKTGGYVNNSDLFINTYLPYADDNTKNLFRLQLDTIQQLNHKISEDKPLVDFANHIQTSDDCVDMKTMAKIAAKNGIKIGRNRLFEFLRERKVLDKDNLPYQKYIEVQPWFEVKESVYNTYYDTHITKTSLVTTKGQVGIVNMLKKYYDSV